MTIRLVRKHGALWFCRYVGNEPLPIRYHRGAWRVSTYRSAL